jgi:hypothetical protein
MGKWLTAMIAVLAMVLGVFAACGSTDDTTTTTEPEAAITVNATEDTTEYATGAAEETESTGGTSTTPDLSAASDASTSVAVNSTAVTTVTAAPAAPNKKPSTQTEILDFFNKTIAKVKADKPGYTTKERTHIDDQKVSSSNAAINTIGPPIIKLFKDSFSKWSDPETFAPGKEGEIRPKVEVKATDVKSATCKESGANYVIRVNLKDERVPTLPEDENSTMHGKYVMARTKSAIADGAASAGVTISKFDCLYSGSYIEITVNKNTGKILSETTYIACQATMIAKVLFNIDASIPLAAERVYTFN